MKARSSGFAPQARCCERLLTSRFVVLLSFAVPQVPLNYGPSGPHRCESPPDYVGLPPDSPAEALSAPLAFVCVAAVGRPLETHQTYRTSSQ